VLDALERIGEPAPLAMRLVRGSHIVVRRLFDHPYAYFFQLADGRIFFAIPYEGDFTLIGTTDRDYAGDPGRVEAGEEEIAYLIDSANRYFVPQLGRDDVVWSYSGVRPLYDNGASAAQTTTRDYVFELDRGSGQEAPLLSIFGGKITTYRELALEAIERLSPFVAALAKHGDWTARQPLPGGDFPVHGAATLVRAYRERHPFLSENEASRLVRHYGMDAERFLASAATPADLGRAFGGGLTEAEVNYLMEEEWAVAAEDVVWRRTKAGLRMTGEEIASLRDFMALRRHSAAAQEPRLRQEAVA